MRVVPAGEAGSVDVDGRFEVIVIMHVHWVLGAARLGISAEHKKKEKKRNRLKCCSLNHLNLGQTMKPLS